MSLVAIAQTHTLPGTKHRQRFSIDNIDKTADPCTDFYQYACGNWLKNTEIPADQSSWVSFIELDERNQYTMRDILDKAAVAHARTRRHHAEDRRLLRLLHGREGRRRQRQRSPQAGTGPNRRRARTRRSSSRRSPGFICIGSRGLFTFYSSPDLHNADMVIANIDQGGLTLPDRNYYIKDDDPKMVAMRQHLVDYATQLFTLAGRTPEQAADSAKTVLRIETALAKASMDRTLRRDPKNRDHKMARDQAVALAPNFLPEPLLHRRRRACVFGSECRQSGLLQGRQRPDSTPSRSTR